VVGVYLRRTIRPIPGRPDVPGIPMKRIHLAVLASALFLPVAAPAGAWAQSPHPIIVESPTLRTGELMPREYTPDGRNISPPLTWRNLPPGTKQIAVLCEDFGAGNPPPWVHWVVYNIPGSATGLPPELPIYASAPMPPGLEGTVQGNNGWNRAIYRGPAPPVGNTNHYNFVVYALDAELNLPPGLNRAALMERIEGHIIGKGEIVPFYQRQPPPPGIVD
jgi:Raf kinase inhibitor-like YbhB/YbcL family protein